MSGNGLKHENWLNNTMFFDLQYDSPELKNSTPIISTESIMNENKAPFQFKLKTNNNISPGNYSLNFTFTYSGSEWKASQLIVSFTIRNIFQRNENLISWIAFIAASVSIVAAIYAIVDFYKK